MERKQLIGKKPAVLDGVGIDVGKVIWIDAEWVKDHPGAMVDDTVEETLSGLLDA